MCDIDDEPAVAVSTCYVNIIVDTVELREWISNE